LSLPRCELGKERLMKARDEIKSDTDIGVVKDVQQWMRIQMKHLMVLDQMILTSWAVMRAIVNLFEGLTNGKCHSEGWWICFDFAHDFSMWIKSNVSQLIK
jgi:hypothetical protein